MARTYWLGPARRAVNVLWKAMIGAGAGRGSSYPLTTEVAGPVLRQYLGDVRQTAPFFDVQAGDPVERFVAEADRHPVFRLIAVPAGG